MKKLQKETKIKLIILGSIIFLFLVLFFIRYIPGVSEFWSRTFSRAYHWLFGHIISWLPISLFETLIFCAIGGGIFWIVLFIIKTKKDGFKKSWTKILTLFTIIFGIVTVYTGTAGMEYYRKPVEVPLRQQLVAESEYEEIVKYFINDINECASKMQYDENNFSKSPYTYSELNKIMKEEFKRLDNDYYSSYTPNAKPLYLTSWLYTELNITGVSFAPTGEPNFNVKSPEGDLPFVMAHEIAHAKGVMREEDANLVACYLTLTSDNYYLRYSGYINVFGGLIEFIKAINDEEKFDNLYSSIDLKVFRDLNAIYYFWKEHNLLEKMSKWWNDLYLRMFGSEDTDAYIDHTDSQTIIDEETEKPKFVINSYSPYQSVLMWIYFNK